MAGDLVLLTGGTGYLGYLTLINLLKAGYKVRAAARSKSKIALVQAAPTFKAINPTAEQLEWTIVPDMTAEGAYDEAARGVKYIVHIASPIPTFGAQPIPDSELENYFVGPARKGDLGILESARRAGTVQRVVLTSSTVAIIPFEYYVGNGDYSVEFTAESRIPDSTGPFAFEFQAYSAGKAAALNASEAWIATQKPGFDIISIIPGWIFGRDELVTNVQGLKSGSTNSVLLGLLLGGKNEAPLNPDAALGEEVADLHVRALDPKIEGNQSFIAATAFEWEASVQVLKKSFAGAVAEGKLSMEGKQPSMPLKVSNVKTLETFGYKFTPADKIVEAVAGQYLELLAQNA